MSPLRILPIIVGALILLGCAIDMGPRQAPVVDMNNVHYRFGDSPDWSGEVDLSEWDEAFLPSLSFKDRIGWLRAEVEVSKIYRDGKAPLAIEFIALASSEYFWNGRLIGTNGTPAARLEDETPGSIGAVIFVPPGLIREGKNSLAIRLSSHHLQFAVSTQLYGLYLGPLDAANRAGLLTYFPTMLLLGLFAIGAIYFGLIGWLGGADRSALWLAGAAAMAGGQLVAEISRAFINYSYDWHLPRIMAVLAFAGAFGFCTTAFSGERIFGHLPKKELGIGLLMSAPVVIFFPGFDGKTVLVIFIFFIISTIIAWRGTVQGKLDARPLFITMLFAIFLTLGFLENFLDRAYYFVVAGLLTVLFGLDVMANRRNDMLLQASLVRSARIELELLKRQLNPHFIMNTLTALTEWIEENPAEGVRMIESLADEFRLLLRMSDQPIVTLEEELALCRAHLELLSFRKGRTYSLVEDVADPNIGLPPALIHTLIENAVSHGRLGDRQPQLKLRQGCKESTVFIEFISPFEVEANEEQAREEGLGYSYVRARLAECFDDEYVLDYGPQEGKWVTHISFPMTRVSDEDTDH